MLQRINITSVLLIITIMAGGVGLVLLLLGLEQQLATQRRIFRDDIVWIASQVEREARTFRHALILYEDGVAPQGQLYVQRSFDVLWSRIESMDQGELGRIYLQLAGAADAVHNGRVMLHTVDPLLRQLQEGDLQQRDMILALTDKAVSQFYQVALHASAFNLQQQEMRRKGFESTSRRAMLLLAIIFLSGGVLVILLTQKQRALNRLTRTLEDKVRDRTVELERSGERLRMLSIAIEQSPASVVICNCDGLIDYVNARFEQVSGYRAKEVIGRNPRFLQSGKTPRQVYEEMWATVRAGREWRGQVCNKRRNGELYWEQMSLTPIRDARDNSLRYLAVKEDVTQRRQYEEQLLRQANFDSLTGLPNRMLAMDRLAQVIRQARRREESVGLLFVDLDHFKRVNDTMGHDVGDQLLREASKRLTMCLRECDTAARFGGDEFVVILPELKSPVDVQLILQRISRVFANPFLIRDTEVFTTTSIGVSLYPGDGDDPMLLLRNADAAMYQAKFGGRNTYRFFVEEMNHQAEQRARLERNLRTALVRRELHLHFQPIVRTGDGQLVGAEALLRWSSPELGNVSPITFIPVAEDSGLIVEIGAWLLTEACHEAQRWLRETGMAIDIAINVSTRQFRDPGFVETVCSTIDLTGISVERIKLEITESLLIEDEQQARQTMDQLMRMGLRLSIDDFGTGYSSLSYLSKFPIDTLKIDRAFLKNVVLDSNEAALATAILALGQSLRLNLVGEGVETLEQLTFLRERGCQMCQGFYFSRPLPADDFLELIRCWQPPPTMAADEA